MPGPNLRSKRLVYLRRDEIFRYVQSHPFT